VETELDWRPTETFQSEFAKTVEWFLAHLEWVDHIRDGRYRDWVDTQYGKAA